MKKTNITSLAKELKMSPSTISRALNNSGRISKKTIEKVKIAAQKLGYVPNIHARRLLGEPSKTIGVCCSQGFAFSAPDYYMLELTQALIEAAGEVNHNLIVFNTGEYKKLKQMLDSREIDGLIIIVDNPKSCIKLANKLSPFPCVILGCPVNRPRQNLSTVTIDREGGARKATEHLLSLGHRKIGFIRGIPADPRKDDKFDGFISAMENANVKIYNSLIADGNASIDTAIKAATKIIKKNATAILCETDWIALGSFRAAETLGKKIPKDISVVGFNDCAFSANLAPPLTTIKIPLDVLAKAAANSIINMISGKTSGDHSVISTQLIIRASSAKISL